MSDKGELDLTGAKQNTGMWLVKLEKWTHVHLMKFSKVKCKSLCLGQVNPQDRYRLRDEGIEGSHMEKSFGELVPKYLSQQWNKASGRGEVGKLRIVNLSLNYIFQSAKGFGILLNALLFPYVLQSYGLLAEAGNISASSKGIGKAAALQISGIYANFQIFLGIIKKANQKKNRKVAVLVYVLLMLGLPELEAVFQVGFQESREEQNYLRPPACHSSFGAAQDTVGFLGCKCTLLGYIELSVKQNPPNDTKIEKTCDLRDSKPQKPDGHWDAFSVGESCMAVLSLGFFVDVHW
ncbi:hypothetical protein WISP_14452 [Willisornis vidua]|uniref:Uncharacterized protein n=1 Tax=Willisornis vidua TaxID=1566151 RepID=A0ABQ9DUT8_9PASS|nr:hypothetical protein WISP_14452 [Willisornis vidua]